MEIRCHSEKQRDCLHPAYLARTHRGTCAHTGSHAYAQARAHAQACNTHRGWHAQAGAHTQACTHTETHAQRLACTHTVLACAHTHACTHSCTYIDQFCYSRSATEMPRKARPPDPAVGFISHNADSRAWPYIRSTSSVYRINTDGMGSTQTY